VLFIVAAKEPIFVGAQGGSKQEMMVPGHRIQDSESYVSGLQDFEGFAVTPSANVDDEGRAVSLEQLPRHGLDGCSRPYLLEGRDHFF